MDNLITIKGVRGYIDENGIAQLNIEDVSRGLGFTQSKNGNEYVRWETVENYLSEFGFSQQVGKDQFIPENIFYRLGFKAKNETAEKFQVLVADEILPTIRKHGIYATDNVIDQILNNPDFGIELLTKLKEERAARIEAEKTVTILTHVNKTYTATEIAKELGFKSAMSLNNDLATNKIQFKQNETWVLYSEYADKGYTEIKQTVLDSGKVVYDRRWTQIGREFLIKLYSSKN
jgi:prophage antirepressor-like protein